MSFLVDLAYIAASILFILGFAVVIVGIGVAFNGEFARLIFNSRSYAEPFTVMLFVLFFQTMIEIPLVVMRARERSMLYIFVGLAQLLLGLFFNILFIVILRRGVAGWLLSSLWTSVILCSYLVISTLSGVKSIRFSFSLLKRMLVYTIPLVPASFAMFWIHNGDRFILVKVAKEMTELNLSGLDLVGIYSLGYKFAIMITMFVGQPFFMIWSVWMFDVFEQPGGEKVYARTFTYFAGMILMCWLLLAATIKEVIFLISDPSFHRAYMVVHIVALGYVLREFSDFFKGVLLIRRRTSFIGITTIFSAVVATVLYLVLIPAHHMWGAAWATLLTFLTMSGCMFLACQRVCKVPWEYRRLAVMGGLALIILFSSRYVSFPYLYLNMAIKAAYAMMFFPLLYLVGFFRPEERERITAALTRTLVFLQLKKAST